MITTEEINYAKNLNHLINKYRESNGFEEIIEEAYKVNPTAFEDTIKNSTQYNEWKHYLEKATQNFRFLDIVDIAKVLRKELKNTFGNDIKFSIKTKRGYTDILYITIKPQNEKYLQNHKEYMEEFKRKYQYSYGLDHPYNTDEVFERYTKSDMERLDKNIRNTIRNIVDLFKLDNSDIMTDYFDVNYVAWFKLEVDGESHPGYTGI